MLPPFLWKSLVGRSVSHGTFVARFKARQCLLLTEDPLLSMSHTVTLRTKFTCSSLSLWNSPHTFPYYQLSWICYKVSFAFEFSNIRALGMHAVTEQDGMFLLGFVASQRLFVRDKILLSSPQFCRLVFANMFMSKLILVLVEEFGDNSGWYID